MASNSGTSTLKKRETSMYTEFMFYDKLPKSVKKLVRDCPLNISSETLYRSWMKHRRNGVTLVSFVDRIESQIRTLMKKDSIRLYGENYPI